MVEDGWILDACAGSGVDIWAVTDGAVLRRRAACTPSFYLTLPDPHAHWEMLDALDRRYGIEECTFRTIYGPCEGYLVHADRRTAEAIERQTRAAARMYNVDVRLEQRYFAARNRFPCGYPGESRFSTDFTPPFTVMEVRVSGAPRQAAPVTAVEIRAEGKTDRIRGPEPAVVDELMEYIGVHDPDVILFPRADRWTHRIADVAEEEGIPFTPSRSGRYRTLGSRSYWSYGRREFRPAAVIPEGRLLIDTEASFVYREGGLEGVLLASRLAGIAPNLASRFTPGTLVSSYEVYEALRRGIAVPFRKSDAERVRGCAELRASDRGGMIFQPVPGLYGRTFQLDFTSLYPTIIVRYNLSPETLEDPGRRGFLAEALAPLLELRIATKQGKKTDPSLAGMDSILKWMLVTCFGYTGYRNAKFGRIEMHERITALARDILLNAKEIAEDTGFTVLHGIVDCLWVQGEDVAALKRRIERASGIPTECDAYDWIVFLPQADGSGSYTQYFGRLDDGSVRVRGLMARRRDTPPYVARMQRDLFALLAEAAGPAGIDALRDRAREIYRRFCTGLAAADPGELAVTRRISRTTYARNSLEAAAVRELRRRDVAVAPGTEIAYVVRDARRWLVDPAWDAAGHDDRFYRGLLAKAWGEVAFAFSAGEGTRPVARLMRGDAQPQSSGSHLHDRA